ncbi:MAG: AF1514 family protein [Desulfosoma sp.]
MTLASAKSCIPLHRSMLENVVDVVDRTGNLSFEEARQMADREAAKRSTNPMLLAWYDHARGVFSPNVECCESSRPAWLVYAQSRGADVTVAINGLDYVFVYRSTEPDNE